MSAINTRTKKAWEESQKREALKHMEILVKKIKCGKLKVVSAVFWSSGIDGGAAFRLDVKENS